ncbi:MAG TPA: OmpA family protein [Terriglobales bacterium]|nr:OmpA family protein [Terriglobales bacterium]
MKNLLPISLVLLASAFAVAQETQTQVEHMDRVPTFRVTVVSRSTSAVNYRHHSGKTEVEFRGTEMMPEGKGKAKVESRTGRLEIETDVENLRESRSYGPEYLTYVLWAITPEGRAANLGEVVPRDGKSSIKVTTDLQSFGMIITAEPYFAVTKPSNLVVMENIVKRGTKGWEQPIDAKYELLERGGYTVNINPTDLPATAADPKTPTDLLEARNAVAMARAAGAEKYAPDVLRKAEDFLARGEDYYHRKQGDKAIGTVARGAVQSAEDARVLTYKRRHDEELAAQQESERQKVLLAQQNEADAKARAEEEVLNRQKAEEDRREAERARADAEAARAAAVAAQQAATAQAAQTVAAAERDKEETRQRLLGQLNQVLQTRESARGLIVDMPDVLFDTGQYTLKPGARERLAKVAGILLAYPGLRVQVEGHTDSVGGDGYNQTLSENRAAAVRDYLTSQGVSRDAISSQGFGKTQPVASNDTASGRQQNRRVDLVVSGEAIGTTASLNAPVQ